MESRGHALVVPFPTPGHINPLLQLSHLLHSRGFHVTFVVTSDVHAHLLRSGTAPHLHPADRFRIEVVSDGVPRRDRAGGMEYLRELTVAAGTTFVSILRERVAELLVGDPRWPRITCVIAGLLGPVLRLAEEMAVPGLLFWTTSACGFMGTLHIQDFLDRGYVPLKGSATNGTPDTMVDWIPGMRPLRLREITPVPDPDDFNIEFQREAAVWAKRADGVILNTVYQLEKEVIDALRPVLKRLYTIGPISALCDAQLAPLRSLKLSFWKEDRECLSWLDAQEPRSVLYVNFGSIAMVDADELRRLAVALARSGLPFLWIIRPNLVGDEPHELGIAESTMEEAKGRGLITSWCPQDEVLAHPAVGGFLTHAGWNSMMESFQHGVPMLCRPMIFDQLVNCRYACDEWGVALELAEGELDSGGVEAQLRELMAGAKEGRCLRVNADKWKEVFLESVETTSSNSFQDFEALLSSLAFFGKVERQPGKVASGLLDMELHH